MTIEQMDDIIQDFCIDHGCEECDLRVLCDAAKGDFLNNPDFCEQAFKIVMRNNPVNDPVNHPAHYNKGKIEVSDFIWDQKLNFDRGNAVKYVCRAGSKDPDKEIQDLEKAIWYINHEIKMLKGEANDGSPD